ncbi:ferredoxin-type protein NapF [Sulfurimonas aquatica]|uniref:Ferredoxin-type protein NapF n=1 Tax=Sulfurimonas aquatica TaxID=2672570 RepID=A0A975B144_9BACT|nr:ferredoxin-type protein NapF [Sulfurimonas aquatica]QSZ42319.1 ferredoxin-type protein NapF [Sulfurimonas aquatica]
MNRRELFGSLTSGLPSSTTAESEIIIRPPYNNDEMLFTSECQNCDAKCVSVCEEEIIKIADDQTPYLSFESSGCTFCDECAIACEFGVLEVENKKNVDVGINISVSSCLSWENVMCFSCKDPCLENAIVFQGLFKPVIDDSKCTSCGFCISRCPASSIEIVALA